MSLHLSEDSANTVRWVLQVYARVPERKDLLGVVRTRPVTDPSGALPLGRASRTVALAYCPGAIGWDVLVDAEQADTREGAPPVTAFVGDLVIALAECCGPLHRPGVQPVDADTVGDSIHQISTANLTIGNVGVAGIASANPWRRRLILTRGQTAGDPAGSVIYIGPTAGALGFALYPGSPPFETRWTGDVLGTADAPGRTLSVWEESE